MKIAENCAFGFEFEGACGTSEELSAGQSSQQLHCPAGVSGPGGSDSSGHLAEFCSAIPVAYYGEADKLRALLSTLGYSEAVGTWRYPERQAIFVGDLIYRGPKQRDTVDIVRAMVDARSARCILGNHEFNAVAWVTEDPERAGHFLRDHHNAGNQEQYQAFLDAVVGTSRHEEITDWFRTLPMWLDLGGLRVVHACWHEDSMLVLRPVLGPAQTLTEEAVLWV